MVHVCKPTITKTSTEYADNCVHKSSKTVFLEIFVTDIYIFSGLLFAVAY